MKKLHGIVALKDGGYVMAAIVKKDSGWQLHGSARWSPDKAYRKHLLFHKGIHLGLESHWAPARSLESGKFATTENSGFFSACLPPFQLQFHAGFFEHNLLGTHPDDLYLCTVPLYMQPKPRDSFVSVFQEESCWKIGIIIERKPVAVFSFPCTPAAQLDCCISRLERFWSTLNNASAFPDIVYIFNDQKPEPGDHRQVERVETSINDPDILKAAGIAFCEIDTALPRFAGATEASKSRKRRSLVYIFSLVMVCFSLLSCGTLFLLNVHYRHRIKICQDEYNRILTGNKEIRDLLGQGESLAAKLKRIVNLSSDVTCWNRFLQELGQKRPQRLFFERLGSEPTAGEQKVRIVLSGWADNESTVTLLIKNLNTSKLLSHISLSSMERDSKQKDYYRFKILCILKLSKS